MTKLQKTDGLSFGDRADLYHIGRKGYPQFIFDRLELEVGHFGENAVDVGCGTGIATRQLSDNWRVTGVDQDSRMLFVARYVQSALPPTRFPITYRQERANKLSFKAETQRLVASFGAFHYFATPNVVAKFKRVLVPGGVACVAHHLPQDKDLFEVAWRSVVAQYIGEVPRRHKDEINYNPRFVAQLLRDGGFVKVRGRYTPHVERYTLAEAVARVQSMTHWKSIPPLHQSDAERALRLAFESLRRKGEDTVERLTHAWLVLGTKPG